MNSVQKLIIRKFSILAIPKDGGFGDGLEALIDDQKRKRLFIEAENWVREVITLIKSLPDNPYETDEEIAGEILKKIEEKSKKNKGVS